MRTINRLPPFVAVERQGMDHLRTTRIQRLCLAAILVTVHSYIWLWYWGFTTVPTVASTSRGGSHPFTEQYWSFFFRLRLYLERGVAGGGVAGV